MAFEETKKVSRSYYAEQFAGGRSTLLAVILMSIINIVMLLSGSDSYFLFSASVPYYLTFMGMYFDSLVNSNMYTVTAIVISAVILALYFVCWLLSKKRPGWLTATLVLFILDTLTLLYFVFVVFGSLGEFIIDLLLHGLVLFQLIRGVLAARKMRTMEPEVTVTPEGCQGTTPDLD